MPHSTRSIRVGIASLIALLLIGGAYAISGPNPWFGLGRVAEAQSAEELLKEYAVQDTDTDGLPDWQESLYGTDPRNPESFRAGIKDGEAVAQGLIEPKVMVRAQEEPTNLETVPGTAGAPNSLTDRFAQAFLTRYLNNRGELPPTAESMQSFVEAGVADLIATSAVPDRYALSDVRTSGSSGTEALRSYVVAVEAAFDAHEIPGRRSELAYFSDALRGDVRALSFIDDVSEEYENIARDLMGINVPSEARQAHLAIANALVRLSEASADLASMDEDPLRALVGITLYQRYPDELIAAFANLGGVLSAYQVQIAAGSPGFDAYTSAMEAVSQ